MAHTYTSLHFHFIFSTKDRQSFISSEIKDRLWSYMACIINEEFGHARLINGMSDHVHICADIKGSHAPSEVMRSVKAQSSKWMKGVGLCPKFSWQGGYSAFSVSKSVLPKVIAYIQNQESHHQKTTFQEELLSLLDRHGVEYEKEYLWN